MQSDEVALSAVGMGTPGAVLAEFRGDPCKEPQHHHRCLQADVAISVKYLHVFLYPWLRTNSCPSKVYDGAFRMEYDHLLSVS